MNKWIIGFGTFLLLIVTAWALPITIKNPTTNNIILTSLFGLLTLAGIYLFSKDSKPDKKEEVMDKLTPVD